MSNIIIQHLEALRQAMKEASIDLYIQPSSDPHLSEYVADRFKGREFLSGFTGSAGTLLVTAQEAVCYTDGRYFIQAEKELTGSTVKLMKLDTEGYPNIVSWIKSHCDAQGTIGLDGRLYSHSDYLQLTKDLKSHAYNYTTDQDLLNKLWLNRPNYPQTKAFVHDIQYTGSSTADKLTMIRQQFEDKTADTYIMTSLNDIAWLFNIRAHDVAYTPVAYAYAIITSTKASLYINVAQVDSDVHKHLSHNGVDLHNYADFYKDLEHLSNLTIFIDPNKTNALTLELISNRNQLIQGADPTYMTKARLNSTEIQNLNNAQIKDGVAMVKFLSWFDNAVANESISERDAEVKLEAFRAQQDLYIEPSFRTIPAYGPNGAMMHYSTPLDQSPLIERGSLFLLDSGGQYYDGTTDITRTIATGPLSDEAIRDYTLVLKAHIRLNLLTFLKGITGTNIDIIARQCMWENHIDYKSGTGHSVGYLLGVHEGPARIRKEASNVVLQPGMILTNEPGIYKEGKYGIRIENTLYVKVAAENDTGTYLDFDVISFCPIDLRCVDPELLDPKELQWLNDYHSKVYAILSPYLDSETNTWLKQATQALLL